MNKVIPQESKFGQLLFDSSLDFRDFLLHVDI